jgi:hypothetical protein
MTDEADDEFLLVEEAARKMRMAKRTLDNHRWKNTGPKFRRHGGRIVYRLSDLLAWSEQRSGRTATQERCRTPASSPAGHSGHWPSGSGMAKASHSDPALEYQSQHPNWPLPADIQNTEKRPARGHPPP